MKLTSRFNFIMTAEGNTGYNNNSVLTIDFGSPIGSLTLNYKFWDLRKILTLGPVCSLTLEIPSGKLESYTDWYCPVTVTQEESKVIFSFFGAWEGKEAGLLGGMSGYGSFCFFDADNSFVSESTLIPRYEGAVTFKEYAQKKAKLIEQLGYEKFVAMSREVAEAKTNKEDFCARLDAPEWYSLIK